MVAKTTVRALPVGGAERKMVKEARRRGFTIGMATEGASEDGWRLRGGDAGGEAPG